MGQTLAVRDRRQEGLSRQTPCPSSAHPASWGCPTSSQLHFSTELQPAWHVPSGVALSFAASLPFPLFLLCQNRPCLQLAPLLHLLTSWCSVRVAAMARDSYHVSKNIHFLKSQCSILTRIHFSGKNMDGYLMSPRGIYCQHFLCRKNGQSHPFGPLGTKSCSLSTTRNQLSPETEKMLPFLSQHLQYFV